MKSVLKIEAVSKKLRGRMAFFHELTHALDTYRTWPRYARSLLAFAPVEKPCEGWDLIEQVKYRDRRDAGDTTEGDVELTLVRATAFLTVA